MFQPDSYLTTLFYRLREDGFNLSIREYFSAKDAIKEGWGTKNKEDFKKLLRLLWCSSWEQQDHLALIFDTIVIESEKTTDKPIETKKGSIPFWLICFFRRTIESGSYSLMRYAFSKMGYYLKKSSNNDQINSDSSSTFSPTTSIEIPSTVTTKPATQELSSLPITTPQPIQEYEDDSEFVTHYPISRRFMVYSWRYLRRPIADGVRDVLDIKMTVEEATKQGFFLQPVYCRREKNHAHLLILVDQEGSMTPFHHFSRDLVETAQYESSIEKVDVAYFHNLPAEYIYRDRFLTDKIALETVLNQCDSETRVLMVSDGGAARGYRHRERVSATTEVIWEIQQHTNLIAWLNPVPQLRWNSTTAKIISHLVPMFPMNREGLIQAISTLQR